MKKISCFTLFSSIISLIMTCFLLVISIYSWYSNNDSTSANGITGSVEADEGGGVSIESSSNDSNYLYPFKEYMFKISATEDINKLIVGFNILKYSEESFKEMCKNIPELVLGKYHTIINNNIYDYSVSTDEGIELLWDLFSNNNIMSCLVCKLIVNNKIYEMKKDETDIYIILMDLM